MSQYRGGANTSLLLRLRASDADAILPLQSCRDRPFKKVYRYKLRAEVASVMVKLRPKGLYVSIFQRVKQDARRKSIRRTVAEIDLVCFFVRVIPCTYVVVCIEPRCRRRTVLRLRFDGNGDRKARKTKKMFGGRSLPGREHDFARLTKPPVSRLFPTKETKRWTS